MAYVMYEIRSAKTGRLLGRAKKLDGVKRRVVKAHRAGTRVKVTKGGRVVPIVLNELGKTTRRRRVSRKAASRKRPSRKTSRRRTSVRRNTGRAGRTAYQVVPVGSKRALPRMGRFATKAQAAKARSAWGRKTGRVARVDTGRIGPSLRTSRRRVSRRRAFRRSR